MPIGMIMGLGNFVLNLFARLFKLITEQPQYLIFIFFILLFFPLEILDMVLYALIFIMVVIINTVIIIIVLILNTVIFILNLILGFIESAIQFVINMIEAGVNFIITNVLQLMMDVIDAIPLVSGLDLDTWSAGNAPSLTISPITYSTATLSYSLAELNIFGTLVSEAYFAELLGKDVTCLFDITGLGSPLW